MEFEFVIVHHAGIFHQAADAPFHLQTAYRCAEPMHDDMTIQYMVHYDNEPCLVDPDADSYFEVKVDDFLRGLTGHSEGCKTTLTR